MKQKALGMIETKGLVPAIEAGDAGVKAANVKLLGYEIVKGGLVMVAFTGEVAAVQASVSAGCAAAIKVGQVISEHVIPRPEADLRMVFKGDIKEPEDDPPLPDPEVKSRRRKKDAGEGDSESEVKLQSDVVLGQEGAEPGPKSSFREDKTAESARGQESTGEKDLASMKVGELRKLARKTSGINIHGREISRANKERLIKEIIQSRSRKD